jgi:hypothetical protein
MPAKYRVPNKAYKYTHAILIAHAGPTRKQARKLVYFPASYRVLARLAPGRSNGLHH